MKLKSLLIPGLLLGAGALAFATNAPSSVVAIEDDYELLVADYEAAVEHWKELVEKATKIERRELRDSKPAIEFWPLFEELGEQGNGRALLWMASHVRDAGIKVSKRDEVLMPIYATLIEEHLDADWFSQVLGRIYKDRRVLGEEESLGFCEVVISNSKVSENRACALFQAAAMMSKSKDAETQERGDAYLVRITEDFSETSWAEKVREIRASEAVQVGKIAPDFEAKTIDGFEFSLSDYRGKVVLLDFYGFW
jgi:hypothetical protein